MTLQWTLPRRAVPVLLPSELTGLTEGSEQFGSPSPPLPQIKKQLAVSFNEVLLLAS